MRFENDSGVSFSIYPAFSKEEKVSVYVSHLEGDITEMDFNKEEVDQIVDALYAALGLEVIPLRDELLEFLKWHDPYFNMTSNPHDVEVDRYFKFLERTRNEKE